MVYGMLILIICMWRPAGILSIFEERIRRRAAPR
jgi:ABC-type branched-subunit amino acid transport system permease subunit